jgi:imidazolonepropionase-like amidohydrolase
MLRSSLVLLLLTLFLVHPSAQAKQLTQPKSLAITHVTVVNMGAKDAKHALVPDQTVIITGNRITAVGRTRRVKVPAGARVIEATGKFLIPGLWDNYTFALEAVGNNHPFFELMIAHGVTGVRDAGASMDLREAAKLRAAINSGEVLAPRLFYAGTVLIGEMPPRQSDRWTGISTVVKTIEEARKAVESLAVGGVDYIKTEKRLPPEILKVVIDAAHKHKLPVVAVPPSFIIDASNDGLDCIEHFAEINRETSEKRNEYYALYRDRTIDRMTIDENYAFFSTMERDVPYYNETLKTLARNKTYVVTNGSVLATFAGDYELADASRRRLKTKKQLERLEAAIAERARQIRNQDYRMSDKTRERHFQDILDLQKAGVVLLAGTQISKGDSGTPGLVLHDELALLVRAGLSPFEALKTATVNPAKFMRREKELGTIERGKLADLVLLDANPLESIGNTQRINAVVANGRLLDRQVLDALLTQVEAAAKRQ